MDVSIYIHNFRVKEVLDTWHLQTCRVMSNPQNSPLFAELVLLGACEIVKTFVVALLAMGL
jgi:hypothetical protein